MALFYLVLVFSNFRGALLAALAWSYVALLRRLRGGQRVSTLLLLGTTLLTVRTVVAFITGSTIVYFAQPMASRACRGLVPACLGSGRAAPLRGCCCCCWLEAVHGQRFSGRDKNTPAPSAREPGPPAGCLDTVFFVRISVLWATVLLLNAGIVLWLLLSSSLRAFVLERMAVTWGFTALAIYLSVTRFVAAMRKDGITVEWGRYRQPTLATVDGP